ncbi:hypothetical protein ELH92_03940 [Rhizobium ruizarguesonis]|nr:hypothetical protein ELH92_03940 [Rhizobium ruizarguesonis]TAZ17990.1 hypothetical protein ELH77_03865 [Rhizobium ruizarguesonis]TBC97928.1 hypothetical protein ELH25_03935 [Rhizobium ruizarguesonis]TBD14767.1 hypothetical protein ELH24_03925 [Rhizobium ruizarguesonis]TBE05244.1 hypothetical protein ELH12_04005 [Rhizobium ruizarguesonis]
MDVVGKTGFAGPLIRPTGTSPRWGEEGIEMSQHALRPAPARVSRPLLMEAERGSSGQARGRRRVG